MAQLPPKIPNWPDFSPHQKMGTFLQPPPTTCTTTTNTNSQSPSWVDEFLDFSSVRRGSHRRSASDSIAYLEAPHMVTRHIANDDHDNDDGHDDRFDGFDEQLFISMFNHHEISPLAAAVGPTLSSSDHSAPSDHNSNNEEKHDHGRHEQQQQQPKNESDEEEEHSSCKSEAQATTMQEAEAAAAAETNATSDDRIFDPKRVKRILANRQSAQRSRVRKLQYISELERSVNSLQAEVSVLSPRVAFLDHQRLLLNVDNSAIKQRIAALAQDKIFKDAHQEALKREIERLRQVYHQQSVKKTENKPPSSPLSCDTNNGSTEKEAELLSV